MHITRPDISVSLLNVDFTCTLPEHKGKTATEQDTDTVALFCVLRCKTEISVTIGNEEPLSFCDSLNPDYQLLGGLVGFGIRKFSAEF